MTPTIGKGQNQLAYERHGAPGLASDFLEFLLSKPPAWLTETIQADMLNELARRAEVKA